MKKAKYFIFILLPFLTCMSYSQAAVDGLQASIRPVPGISHDSTAAAYAQRVEMLDKVNDVLNSLLYSKEGKQKAYEEGRRIFKDYQHGTITVVDTKANQQKVQDYLDQLQTAANAATVKPQGRILQIKHADPNNLRNLINQVIQESRTGQYGANGNSTVGEYVTGVITPGAGNGLTFYNVTVELIDFPSQDTANPSARLYIYTPTRDREVTLTKGNSELVDAYRIRLISADPIQQEAEVEIRVANATALR